MMANGQERVPPGVDVGKPSIARCYDYLIGGSHNYEVDRELGASILRLAPEAQAAGLTNRAFLRRTVRFLAEEAGIRQFLDVGSGLPTQGNVHEIAQRVDPDARVVYVDVDPIVLAHGQDLLADNDTTTVVQADIREPELILNDPAVQGLIDFDRSVGLLLFAILHHLNDAEDPVGIMDRFRAALAPGSHVVVSHFFNPADSHPEASAAAEASERLFSEGLGTGRWRTRQEILDLFGDWPLIEPGLVSLPDWRPDAEDPELDLGLLYYQFAGGVARKP